MPTLPWTIPNPAPPGTQAHAMASRFEVGSARDVPRFFLKSLVAWRQVRSAPGCVGASLIAQPLQRVFYTLSAWENRDALYAFARTQPHRGIMASLRPTMRSSTFTFWNARAEQLPLTWDDAKRRLTVGSPEPSGLRTSSRVHPEGLGVNGWQEKEFHA
jgi:quinol monooxygenase YgiN